MQQLKVEHKKSTTNNSQQKVVSKEEETKKDRRSGKGLVLALSRRVYRILNSDTFYVESETSDNIYYFVRYEPSFQWCSCPDNSIRGQKCKHQFAIIFAIMKGTLKDIDKLPAEAKRYGSNTTTALEAAEAEDWRNDNYDF